MKLKRSSRILNTIPKINRISSLYQIELETTLIFTPILLTPPKEIRVATNQQSSWIQIYNRTSKSTIYKLSSGFYMRTKMIMARDQAILSKKSWPTYLQPIFSLQSAKRAQLLGHIPPGNSIFRFHRVFQIFIWVRINSVAPKINNCMNMKNTMIYKLFKRCSQIMFKCPKSIPSTSSKTNITS